MTLAVVLAFGGLVLLGVIICMRWLDARAWRRSLVAYRVHPPAGLTPDDVAQWLSSIAAITHPRTRFALLPLSPVVCETVSTTHGIAYYVLVTEQAKARVLTVLRAALPGARILEVPDYRAERPVFRVAAEVIMTTEWRPLASERAKGANAALLAALQPVSSRDEIRLQWIVTSGGTPAPVPGARANKADQWSSYLIEGTLPKDAEAVQAARLKQQEPLLQAVTRVGVAASNKQRAWQLLGNTWNNLHALNAPGVRLRRRYLPSFVVTKRMTNYALPLTRWPLLINAQEAAGLLGLPVTPVPLPGLALGTARQLPPHPDTPRRGTILADSNYPGMQRPLAIGTTDRLKHTYILGPTGTGKSTLIANTTLQDIQHGAGVALIDPKSDLVHDILARMPDARRDDVIVLNPAATDQPIGFNLLGDLHNEHDRELAVDHVVHIMSSLWHDAWGPRSNDIVTNALLTLTHTRAPDDSAFTLVEVPELLTNPTFRRFVTSQGTIPSVVRSFWITYDQMSDAERHNMIAAPMNKLRALTSRSALRLLLGQSTGIEIADVFRARKILLVPLSEGILGAGAAHLLGALLLSSLVRATFARASLPPEQRRPAFIVVDEFQNVLRLPLSIADGLAMARGYHVGFTLANQHLGQLPEAVKTAVLGTARTSIVFQLDYGDARTMAPRFAPLTADDLMGLDAYEVAMRLSVNGQTQRPVTGTTRSLAEPTTDADALAADSRVRYGVPRAEVEAAIKARITPPRSPGQDSHEFGRRTRGGRS